MQTRSSEFETIVFLIGYLKERKNIAKNHHTCTVWPPMVVIQSTQFAPKTLLFDSLKKFHSKKVCVTIIAFKMWSETIIGCFLFCTAAVALRALQHHGKIQKGQRVLITGGSGGVGVHAIQIARILGAEVVTTTTNPAKEKLLKDLGAGEVLIGSSGFEKSASIQEL